MAILGREQFRSALLHYVEVPGARLFRAAGLTPNALTLIGFAICVASAVLVGAGWLLAGGIVFLVGSGLDLFDGALARLSGKATAFGALLDSVFDRLGEASLLLGLAVYALLSNFSEGFTLAFLIVLLLALIFSQGVSYLRARGEGLDVFIRSGVMTRTERVIILGAGLIADALVGSPLSEFPLMFWVLLVIAAVSCFTLFQRMFTIRGLLDQDG